MYSTWLGSLFEGWFGQHLLVAQTPGGVGSFTAPCMVRSKHIYCSSCANWCRWACSPQIGMIGMQPPKAMIAWTSPFADSLFRGSLCCRVGAKKAFQAAAWTAATRRAGHLADGGRRVDGGPRDHGSLKPGSVSHSPVCMC